MLGEDLQPATPPLSMCVYVSAITNVPVSEPENLLGEDERIRSVNTSFTGGLGDSSGFTERHPAEGGVLSDRCNAPGRELELGCGSCLTQEIGSIIAPSCNSLVLM